MRAAIEVILPPKAKATARFKGIFFLPAAIHHFTATIFTPAFN